MKSIKKRIMQLEETLNISDLPSYKDYMNDIEGKFDDIDLNEILKREKNPFDIVVIHDLLNKDEKIKSFKEKGNCNEKQDSHK